MRYYTTESLGPQQHLTPEGYLLCPGVRIARTGTMLYAAGEVPVSARDGVIRIQRDAEAVFAHATIASFEGKPDRHCGRAVPPRQAPLGGGHGKRRGSGANRAHRTRDRRPAQFIKFMQANLLHVVTAIANPIRWQSRISLYRAFEQHMLEWRVYAQA